MHYTEHLVTQINKHQIDPVEIMDLNRLKCLLRRNHITIPSNQSGTDKAYMLKLTTVSAFLLSELGVMIVQLWLSLLRESAISKYAFVCKVG